MARFTDPKLTHSVLSGPIPGQSLTHAPKAMAWEQPPQFTKLSQAMNWLMDQMTNGQYMKQLLHLMDAGMPIEAITRTILFSGFTQGKWTPDLGMLMYKPVMMALMAIAKRAGIDDVPVVMPSGLDKHMQTNVRMSDMLRQAKGDKAFTMPPPSTEPKPSPSNGFMVAPQGIT